MSSVRYKVRPPEILAMRTEDGVRLDTDVYWPEGEGPFPVLLMRQAYGRRIASTLCYAHPSWYAAQGYIVAVQDVRGRGSSEGAFRTLEHEAADGAAAVRWAAALAGSNGRVGMYGFSYQGTVQLLAATTPNPALRALCPAMLGWDINDGWAREGGAFKLRPNLGWAAQLAAETARRAGDAEAYAELAAVGANLPLFAPNPSRPAFIEKYRAWTHYFDWLERPADDPYWRLISPAAHAEALAASGIPMLFIGGWFDSHLDGTVAAYRDLTARGARNLRLEIGPWTHFPWDRCVGGLDFGPEAVTRIDLAQLRFFDRWLKDAATAEEPALRLFDMGRLAWREFADWPGTPRALFLAGDGRASVDGTAGLLLQAPAEEAVTDTLVHDPWRPAPAIGGAFGFPAGPVDRAQTDARADVLAFTTAPLAAPLAIAGDLELVLHVCSDAPSFDIACVVSRVTPAGKAFQIAEGYRRVASWSAAEPVRLTLRPSCATLAPGEALRVSIAAASWPAYPINPGTGAEATAVPRSQARIITLTIAHGAATPSRLEIGIA